MLVLKTRYDRYRMIMTPLYRFDNCQVRIWFWKCQFLASVPRMIWSLTCWSHQKGNLSVIVSMESQDETSELVKLSKQPRTNQN